MDLLKIAAFDLGAKTGYCVANIKIGGGVHSIEDFSTVNLKRVNSSTTTIAMKKFMQNLHEKYKLDIVVYERLSFSTHTLSTQAHGAYRSCLIDFFIDKADIYEMSPTEIKKGFTNHGSATKDLMIMKAEDVVKKYGKVFSHKYHDDNTADAIGCIFAFDKSQKRIEAEIEVSRRRADSIK